MGEVRELFQQIILLSYERALYLKCLNNELIIPPTLIPILKNKGLLSEGNEGRIFPQNKNNWFDRSEELVSDLLNMTNADESNVSRRPSRMSSAVGSHVEEAKSVKFASSSSSQNKMSTTTAAGLTGGQTEEMNTISTIRTLLQ